MALSVYKYFGSISEFIYDTWAKFFKENITVLSYHIQSKTELRSLVTGNQSIEGYS